MAENKPRRHRRTKANIIASLEQAAIDEITENGFSSALVTGIIKRANVEPQVFYNRYKDILEFYDIYVRRYDSYVNKLIDGIDYPIASRQGLKMLLKKMSHILNSEPVALELIRWEITDANETTKRSAKLRENNFKPIEQVFNRSFKGSGVDINGILTFMFAGVYYLSLHKKLAPFHGIDMATDDGKARFENIVDSILDMVFDGIKHRNRDAEIAERLRALGVSDDIIAKAIDPEPDKQI